MRSYSRVHPPCRWSGRPARLRDVASITTWCYCFLACVATTTSDPVTREQLAYVKLIIRQAQSQGGLAFLDYDRAFRQQKVADPSLRWNTLNLSLLASTTLGSRSSNTQTFCTLCQAVDHTRTQCALLFLEPPQLPVGPAGPQHGLSQAAPRRTRTPPPPPQCVTVGTEGHVLMGYQHVCSNCAATGHKASECPQSTGKPWGKDHTSARKP